ncbi:MAG: hypothetical protein WCC59_07485 [Terriglobales bacterium]
MLAIMTGICAAGVLFLLRFLIALCQEHEPRGAVHRLNFTPVRTNGDDPDAGSGEEALKSGDSHTLRNRGSRHAPAATTARWSEMEVASSAKAKRHSANQGRYSA